MSEANCAKIYANPNVDMVGSPDYVCFVCDGEGSDTPDAGPPGPDSIGRIITDDFDAQGLASEPTGDSEPAGRAPGGPGDPGPPAGALSVSRVLAG